MQIDKANINNQNYLVVCNQGSMEIWALNVTNFNDDAIAVSSIISNYPNPFNPNTTISFTLGETAKTCQVEVYNIKGQLIRTLMYAQVSAGEYNMIWNGRDEENHKVSSGTYFAKLIVNGKEKAVTKMLLLK